MTFSMSDIRTPQHSLFILSLCFGRRWVVFKCQSTYQIWLRALSFPISFLYFILIFYLMIHETSQLMEMIYGKLKNSMDYDSTTNASQENSFHRGLSRAGYWCICVISTFLPISETINIYSILSSLHLQSLLCNLQLFACAYTLYDSGRL